MEHDFKIGDKIVNDKIYHGKEIFEVTGITRTKIEVTGDWSGGTHNVNQSDWLNPVGWKLIEKQNH